MLVQTRWNHLTKLIICPHRLFQKIIQVKALHLHINHQTGFYFYFWIWWGFSLEAGLCPFCSSRWIPSNVYNLEHLLFISKAFNIQKKQSEVVETSVTLTMSHVFLYTTLSIYIIKFMKERFNSLVSSFIFLFWLHIYIFELVLVFRPRWSTLQYTWTMRQVTMVSMNSILRLISHR